MKNMILIAAVTGLIMAHAGSVLATDENLITETINCSGSMTMERPLWQRILSFGLLSKSTEQQTGGEFPFPAPGGAIALAKDHESRKSEIENRIRSTVPSLMHAIDKCIDASGNVLETEYSRDGDGIQYHYYTKNNMSSSLASEKQN